MKDPAFLFYPNDFLGGTLGMSREEKGAYIDLMLLQFNRGHMTKDMIGQMFGHDTERLWNVLRSKFKEDENGCFFNERLEQEQNKRKSYSESRRKNVKGINQHTKNSQQNVGHMTTHMENENRNRNIDSNLYNEDIKQGAVKTEPKKKLKQKFDFKTELINLGVDKKIAEDWLFVRKQKKAANTETAFNAIKKQIEISGLTANDCIKIAVEKSWSGFNAEWVNNQNQNQNGTNKSNYRANAEERKQQRDAEFTAHITAKLNSNSNSGSGDVSLPF